MRLADLTFNSEYTLWVKCSGEFPAESVKDWEKDKIFDLHFLPNNNSDIFILSDSDSSQNSFNVKIREGEPEKSTFLHQLQHHNLSVMALYQESAAEEQEMLFRFLIFYGQPLISGEMEFLIEEKLLKKMKYWARRESIPEFIEKHFYLKKNNSTFLITEDYTPTAADKRYKDFEPEVVFSVAGDRFTMVVCLKTVENKKYFQIFKIFENNRKILFLPGLTEARISILDNRRALAGIQKAAIEEKYGQAGSYFRNWDLYVAGFLDWFLAKARKAGACRIKVSQSENEAADTHTLRFEQKLSEEYMEGAFVEICTRDNLPDIFDDEEISGIKYLAGLIRNPKVSPDNEADGETDEESTDTEDLASDPENDGEAEDIQAEEDTPEEPDGNDDLTAILLETPWEKPFRLPRSAHAEILSITPDRMQAVIKMHERQKLPKDEGRYMYPSLYGTFISSTRALAARKSIMSGCSGIPQLRALIEDTAWLEDLNRRRKREIPALSPWVRKKIFPDHGPTEMQEEAIRLALNTPDILLIQGPPGTGKTTVITAIIERLNELNSGAKFSCGRLLVSAFQHAAVENLVSRLSVNDLPGYKLGRKKDRHGEFDFELDNEEFENWRENMKQQLLEKYPDFKKSDTLDELEKHYLTYLFSPSGKNALAVLNFMEQNSASSDLLQLLPRVRALKSTYKSPRYLVADEILELRRLVRRLRTEPVSFADDGPDNASCLLESQMKKFISDREREVLDKAADWFDGDPLDFIEDGTMKALKEALMLKLIAPPEENQDNSDSELVDLCNQYFQLLTVTRYQHSNVENSIIGELLYELTYSPKAISDALKEFTFPLAATVQYAASAEVKQLKSLQIWDKTRFDTVIVDEAARANPPDLLIPMEQAVERIILVGDHRQLPHIIEEEILRNQDEESPENRLDKSLLTTSLFEHLWNTLKKRTDFVRTITLDMQYRMHPLLGDYVSKIFYERNGERGFDSGLPPEKCRHRLIDIPIPETPTDPHLQDKAVAWFDVRGKAHEYDHGSSFRSCEAQAALKKLKAWMDSESGKKLTFGIITFYRAQVEELNKNLFKHGLADRKGELLDEYKWLVNEKNEKIERLQIGTVDAFQGKEFDVVLLSCVRAPENFENKPGQKIFGRICTSEDGPSRNLLCVAMSRQKKLLAVFGKRSFFESKEAQIHCKELHELIRICDVKNNGSFKSLKEVSDNNA